MLWDLGMLCDPQFPRPARGRQVLPDHYSIGPPASGQPNAGGGKATKNCSSSTSTSCRCARNRSTFPSNGTRSFSPPNFLGIYDGADRLQVYELSAEPVRACSAGFPSDLISTAPFAYSAEARLLAWSDGSDTLHLRSLNDPAEQIDLRSGDKTMRPVRFGPGARHLLATSENGRGSRVGHRRQEPAADGGELSVAIPTGPRIPSRVSTTRRGIAGFTIGSPRPLRRPSRIAPRCRGKRRRSSPRGTLSDRAFSPDGRTFALSTLSGIVALYDAGRRERLATASTGISRRCGRLSFLLMGAASPPSAITLRRSNCGMSRRRQELLTLPGIGALLREATFTRRWEHA